MMMLTIRSAASLGVPTKRQKSPRPDLEVRGD
jgi:hypothetical protein